MVEKLLCAQGLLSESFLVFWSPENVVLRERRLEDERWKLFLDDRFRVSFVAFPTKSVSRRSSSERGRTCMQSDSLPRHLLEYGSHSLRLNENIPPRQFQRPRAPPQRRRIQNLRNRHTIVNLFLPSRVHRRSLSDSKTGKFWIWSPGF